MLALANGFRAALIRTGSSRERAGAAAGRRLRDVERPGPAGDQHPHVVAPRRDRGRRAADGEPRGVRHHPAAAEGVRHRPACANVVVRGVSPAAWTVREQRRIEAGRQPESGKAEICVGKKMAGRFDHTGIGETLRFAGRDWNVVCRFTADGSAFESEIWGENEQFMPVFRGEAFQSVTFRLKDPARVRGGQADPGGRPAAHGGRAPRGRLLRRAVASCWAGSSRSSRS